MSFNDTEFNFTDYCADAGDGSNMEMDALCYVQGVSTSSIARRLAHFLCEVVLLLGTTHMPFPQSIKRILSCLDCHLPKGDTSIDGRSS